MSAIERRVTEGLRAYGEGLSMTAADVDRLEEQLEWTEQDPRTQHRGTFWQGAVAACAVSGLVLGVLALRDDAKDRTLPAGPPSVTLAQLEGIWRVTDSNYLWRFGADGTMTQSSRPTLLTGGEATTVPRVRPTPGGFIMEDDPGEPQGCGMVWDATISPEGRLRARETGRRVGCTVALQPPGDVWELTRVSPTSVAGLATMPDRATSDPKVVTDATQLTGTWLLRGTGTLLTVDSLTGYALQDLGTTAGPETGTVSVRPDGTATFTPHDVAACPAVYTSVTATDTALETQLAAGSCNRLASTSDTWIRLN